MGRECVGFDLSPFLGRAGTFALFHDDGHIPKLYDMMKILVMIGANPCAHDLRMRVGIRSGPFALCTSSFSRY